MFDKKSTPCYYPGMLPSLVHSLGDIIFPRNCMLCRQYHPLTAHDPVCPACRAALPWNTPPFCAHCSRHLKTLSEEGLCPACRSRRPQFDEGWALLHYEGQARELLRRFKFHGKTSVRRTFTTLLHAFISRYALCFPQASMVIPVPLHPARLRERGYNQAALLADGASTGFGLPVRKDILIRARPTARQSELTGPRVKERWTNVLGAFTINPVFTADIVGQKIILVDDVLTTGATAGEAARTLKDAGASGVTLITLAIAPCGSSETTSLMNA